MGVSGSRSAGHRVRGRPGTPRSHRSGLIQTDGERVTDYAYKPDEPQTNVVANEVFVFTPRPVLDALEEIAAESEEEHLDDLGDVLLPRIVDGGSARAHHID